MLSITSISAPVKQVQATLHERLTGDLAECTLQTFEMVAADNKDLDNTTHCVASSVFQCENPQTVVLQIIFLDIPVSESRH